MVIHNFQAKYQLPNVLSRQALEEILELKQLQSESYQVLDAVGKPQQLRISKAQGEFEFAIYKVDQDKPVAQCQVTYTGLHLLQFKPSADFPILLGTIVFDKNKQIAWVPPSDKLKSHLTTVVMYELDYFTAEDASGGAVYYARYYDEEQELLENIKQSMINQINQQRNSQ